MAKRVNLWELPIEDAQPDDTVPAYRGRGQVARVRVPTPGGGGSVTSVGVSVPSGFEVAGSPVTSSGTITISFTSGYELPTTAAMGQWSKAYSWGDHAQAGYAIASAVTSALAGKVDVVSGKGLSTEDYTSADQSKLAGIAPGATANTGTVTSVQVSVPTGLQVSGGPVTTSGVLAISYAAGYSIPANNKQSQWDAAYGWGNHASAGYTTMAAVQGYAYSKSDVDALISAAAGGARVWQATTTALVKNTPNKVDFSSPRTLTLPGAPAENDYVEILRSTGNSTGSTIARNGQTIMGLAENVMLDANINYLRFDFVNGSWRVAS